MPRLVVSDRVPVDGAAQTRKCGALALASPACLGVPVTQMQRLTAGLCQAQQQLLAVVDIRPVTLGIVEQIPHKAGIGDCVSGMDGRHTISVAPFIWCRTIRVSNERRYQRARWCSVTPSPRARGMPPGSVPEKVPNGAR